MLKVYDVNWRLIWSSDESSNPEFGVDWLKGQGVAVAELVPWPTSQVPGGRDNFPSNGVLRSYRVSVYDRGGYFIVVGNEMT